MILLDTHIWVNWILLGNVALSRGIVTAIASLATLDRLLAAPAEEERLLWSG